jgi:sugar PTS system EIIA component
MIKKLFGIKTMETIISPMTGKVVRLEDVPDKVFSQKLVGDGIAIEPAEGRVVSPLEGEVIQLFPTKHAIGIRGKNGLEVLIHIGLDTVELNGEGFQGHVEQGDKVQIGDLLLTVDMELIKKKSYNLISPVVITNSDMVDSITKSEENFVYSGKSVLLTVKKK